MQIDISWFALIKVAATGLITYVFMPLILVLRDLALWAAIERLILTKKLETRVSMYANDVWMLKNKYGKSLRIHHSDNGADYYIDESAVAPDDFYSYSSTKDIFTKRAASSAAYIKARSNLINWLIRHYKQDGDANPIKAWQESAYKAIEETHGKMANKSFKADA